MLAIDSLNQFYAQSHTLHDVSLSARRGRCTVLMGRNGVGKTTLLDCISGLLPVRSGTLELEGQPIETYTAEQRAYAGIGYVPQGRQIFPRLSVEENLRIGLQARQDKRRTVPEHIYDLFPVLREMGQRRGGDLSGGQQQQLAIGRALATDPRFLLLDEPTEGVQPNIVSEIGSIIQRLVNQTGLSILLVEQKLPFARRVGDHFALMVRGSVIASGPMNELTDSLVASHLSV